MTRPDLVARARGLAARVPAADPVSAEAAETTARDRVAAELATLARWGGTDPVVAALILDEDRRSVRALVRGLAGNLAPQSRRAGTTPTPSLPSATIAMLSSVSSLEILAGALARRGHPLAAPLAMESSGHIDLLAIEVALARAFVSATSAATRERAFGIYRGQLVDAENANTALLVAARGRSMSAASVLLDGGTRDLAPACRESLDRARELVAHAFAGTPIAAAVFGTAPSALEDATLEWQFETQARLRRVEPAGAAAVIHAVLRRRHEARTQRLSGWQALLGGAR